jgi:hypothetical protein
MKYEEIYKNKGLRVVVNNSEDLVHNEKIGTVCLVDDAAGAYPIFVSFH